MLPRNGLEQLADEPCCYSRSFAGSGTATADLDEKILLNVTCLSYNKEVGHLTDCKMN
jgi:hypothetical protein